MTCLFRTVHLVPTIGTCRGIPLGFGHETESDILGSNRGINPADRFRPSVGMVGMFRRPST